MKIKFSYILLILSALFFSVEGFSQDTSELEQNNVAIDTSWVYDSGAVEAINLGDLKARYSDEAFDYSESKQNSGWWTRFKQWLSDLWQSIFDFKDAGQSSKLTDHILNVAAVIIVLLVIFFIYKAVVNKEGAWAFGKKSDKEIIPFTSIEQNIHDTKFDELIATAEQENNYRLAIRYYYLWLLKSLSKANVIEYDVEKTNSDYQYEITSDVIREKFAYTSYLYNYIWYGEFNVTAEQFNKAKFAFDKLLKSVEDE